jgi:hypothetical protein
MVRTIPKRTNLNLQLSSGDDFTGRPIVEGEAISEEVLSKIPKSHSKSAQRILKAQKQPPAPTLFIGNLGFHTTNDSIRQLLEVHRLVDKKFEKKTEVTEKMQEKGDWIRKIRMATFEDTGSCRGYGISDISVKYPHQFYLGLPL